MYSIEYHEEVKNDFKKLGHSTTLLVLKKIKKIAQNPFIGDALGNKANINLSGFRKVYVVTPEKSKNSPKIGALKAI